MSNYQLLTTLEKLLFYLEVKRVTEQDHDERYFRDCQDEYYDLIESSQEDL